MVHQITHGVRVSIDTQYEGTFFQDEKIFYGFSYNINIDNQSKDVVQLIARQWRINDSLNHTEIVVGEGVIGLQPVLQPGENHSYSSGCYLQSSLGSMCGYYNMINLSSNLEFRVEIPSFKLYTPFSVN